MVGTATRFIRYNRLYRGRLSPRLWRSASAVLALTLPLLAGGCAYQLGPMFGKDAQPETTASTGPLAATASSHTPTSADIALASAAAADALNKSGANASLPWENPRTGARGTVTPLASAYTQDGVECRDFLASFVRDKSESWLQGAACREHQGKWVVRSLKPWKRA